MTASWGQLIVLFAWTSTTFEQLIGTMSKESAEVAGRSCAQDAGRWDSQTLARLTIKYESNYNISGGKTWRGRAGAHRDMVRGVRWLGDSPRLVTFSSEKAGGAGGGFRNTLLLTDVRARASTPFREVGTSAGDKQGVLLCCPVCGMPTPARHLHD